MKNVLVYTLSILLILASLSGCMPSGYADRMAAGSSVSATTSPTVENPEPTTEATQPTDDVTDPTKNTEHVHIWNDWVTIVAATCTEPGLEQRACDCGQIETQQIDCHSETMEWIVLKEPTRTEDGLKQYVCSACDFTEITAPAYATGSPGLTYQLDPELDVYVVTGIGTCTDTEILVPAFYNDLPVYIIGDGAFKECHQINSVTLSLIGEIGNEAFYDCDNMTSISLPTTLTAIGDKAFKLCTSLSSLELPISLERFGEYAFDCCISLTSIVIPERVGTISQGAFMNCYGLTEVILSRNTTVIHGSAFSCSGLTSIELSENILYIGTSAFCGTKLTEITIPNGVTWFEVAFDHCENLKTVNLPETFTMIGDYSFMFCTGLEEITIPASVTTIGRYAFFYCEQLSDVYYNGTMQEFSKITLGEEWHSHAPITVHCTDGDIPF